MGESAFRKQIANSDSSWNLFRRQSALPCSDSAELIMWSNPGCKIIYADDYKAYNCKQSFYKYLFTCDTRVFNPLKRIVDPARSHRKTPQKNAQRCSCRISTDAPTLHRCRIVAMAVGLGGPTPARRAEPVHCGRLPQCTKRGDRASESVSSRIESDGS
jgi:hypothetical protein